MLYLASSGGYTGRTIYYEAATGEFIALECWCDYIDEACAGRTYWPTRVEFSDCVTTEQICPQQGDEGES